MAGHGGPPDDERMLRGGQALASRAHSQTMLNVLQPTLPGLIGGSADLAPSNLTIMKARPAPSLPAASLPPLALVSGACSNCSCEV